MFFLLGNGEGGGGGGGGGGHNMRKPQSIESKNYTYKQ